MNGSFKVRYVATIISDYFQYLLKFLTDFTTYQTLVQHRINILNATSVVCTVTTLIVSTLFIVVISRYLKVSIKTKHNIVINL